MTKKLEEVRHLGEKKRPTAVGEREKETYDRDYSRYAFSYPTDTYKYVLQPGLSREVIEEISAIKNEPKWMREFRLHAYEIFLKKPMPTWGADLSAINFDTITYYATPMDKGARSWDDVPEEVKKTFDRLGIPEAERKFLAGVGAQYDSEVVYHSIREDLAKKGVIFLSMDDGLREYPELVKEYFGTVIPPTDNKFAALNSAVWSGGSFIYVPKGVHVEIPLQAYFRINAPQMGQFERTLIIADEGARVHYIEGCLPGGEQVSAGDRWVNVESLKPGDYVIADNGEQARVRAVMVRPYRGEMLTIKPISPYN
ncbi:MAG: Fe-S cluster assembly protein SufB, partial [Candidatus Bipolaricaulia bacterium]